MKTKRLRLPLASLLFAFFAFCAFSCGQSLAADAAGDAQFNRFDKNGDGKITAAEAENAAWFKTADKDGDGIVTPEEARAYLAGRGGATKAKKKAAPSAPAPVAPAATAQPATVEIVKTLDVRYADAPPGVESGQLALDIYAPRDAKNLPVMIYIHGGGWRRGDKRAVGVKPEYFTARGFVFVSLNYRFVPAVDILAQLQDSANAIGWVKAKIAQHGGDAARLHLIGHSAGAHHVAVLATNERFLKAAGVELANLKSVVELDTQALDVPTLMSGRENALYTLAFGKDESVWAQVSPLQNVAKDKGVPPFFLVVADERGPKLQQAAAFQKALQAAGVRCEFVEAPQHDHESLNRAIGDVSDKVTQAMEAFHRGVGFQPANAEKKSTASTGWKPVPLFDWQPSLVFDAEQTKDGPLPVNAMNLTVHRGQLFCGMATDFETGGHSRVSSYVYQKAAADAPWRLDADFGPRTHRIGAMCSAHFENDGAGQAIAGGPADVLVAATLNTGRGGEHGPLLARIRDDAAGTWLTVPVTTRDAPEYNVRAIAPHRDSVTGADLVLFAATPAPLGIFAGAYDAAAPGRIRWREPAETVASGWGGKSKWFGLATVNGALLASDAFSLYRRVDGTQPQWVKVLTFPNASDEGGAEVRGLTAVPNPKNVTDWPEEQMLVCATQFHMWRVRVPARADAPHPHASELDLLARLRDELQAPVIFAEAAFNELVPFHPAPGAPAQWPVGFQIVESAPGKEPSRRDLSTYVLKNDAWFFLRDADARYTLQRIAASARPEARLWLARDFKPSPFASEPGVLYACGFNGSYWKNSLGTAWVYRGEVPPLNQQETKR